MRKRYSAINVGNISLPNEKLYGIINSLVLRETESTYNYYKSKKVFEARVYA